MHTFRDKDNFEWRIDLTLGDVKRIEAFDYADALGKGEPYRVKFFPPQDNLFTELITHPDVVFSMVWCCVEEQAQAAGVPTIYDFAKRLRGGDLVALREAFWAELPDFFPEMASTLRALITEYSNVTRLTNSKMEHAVKSSVDMALLEQRLDAEIERMIAENRRTLAGSPGS
jgi:hypothetical protein